jgi:sirohydrochlorin cobaltochelatase
VNDDSRLAAIADRVRTILPPEYQDSHEDLLPAPMPSAGLRYNVDGKVAWDRIWGSFCDLAMAGGPPHKGTLLEPGRRSDIEAQPDRYDEVAEEICRGVRMAADLDAEPSPSPGWVRVLCSNQGMSGWLLRAIVMENVAVRSAKTGFDVPAAPHFRLEKEIKNVVTVVAKTSHYWMGHMPRSQQRTIANLFTTIAEESPLIEPLFEDTPSHAGETHGTSIAERIQRDTGLARSSHRYIGWLGIECPSVRGAIWMMRAMVVSNVLSRREGTVLFVPSNPASDPEGTRVAGTFAAVWRLAAKSVLGDIESAPAKSSGSG